MRRMRSRSCASVRGRPRGRKIRRQYARYARRCQATTVAWFDDRQRLGPVAPHGPQRDPEQAVGRSEPWAAAAVSKGSELVSQGGIIEDEGPSRERQGAYRPDDALEEQQRPKNMQTDLCNGNGGPTDSRFKGGGRSIGEAQGVSENVRAKIRRPLTLPATSDQVEDRHGQAVEGRRLRWSQSHARNSRPPCALTSAAQSLQLCAMSRLSSRCERGLQVRNSHVEVGLAYAAVDVDDAPGHIGGGG